MTISRDGHCKRASKGPDRLGPGQSSAFSLPSPSMRTRTSSRGPRPIVSQMTSQRHDATFVTRSRHSNTQASSHASRTTLVVPFAGTWRATPPTGPERNGGIPRPARWRGPWRATWRAPWRDSPPGTEEKRKNITHARAQQVITLPAPWSPSDQEIAAPLIPTAYCPTAHACDATFDRGRRHDRL